jgi:hypothetical protein
MAKEVVGVHPAAHHTVPGRDIGGVQIGVIVVNLVEIFPRKQILTITVAGDEIAQAFG